MLFSRFLLTTTTLVVAGTAHAAVTPSTYFFYALVTGSNTASNYLESTTPTPDVTVPSPGTVIPISITVDTSFPAFTQQDHVTNYARGAGGQGPGPILDATVNGVDVTGLSQSITITQGLGGLYSIRVLSSSPQGGGSLDLLLKTTIKGVVKNDRIPKQVFPGNFASATFSTSYAFVGYSGQIID